MVVDSENNGDTLALSEADKKRQKPIVPTKSADDNEPTGMRHVTASASHGKATPLANPQAVSKKTIAQPTKVNSLSSKSLPVSVKDHSNAALPAVALKKPPLASTKPTPKPKAVPQASSKAPGDKARDRLHDPVPGEKDTTKANPASSKVANEAKAAAKLAAQKLAEANALASERAALEKELEGISANLTKKLESIEADIENREEEYIAQTWAHGNVMRGWDGFVRRVDKTEKTSTGNGSGSATGAPKHRKSRPSDRIFSLSSSSSNFRRENPDAIPVKRPGTMKKKKKR